MGTQSTWGLEVSLQIMVLGGTGLRLALLALLVVASCAYNGGFQKTANEETTFQDMPFRKFAQKRNDALANAMAEKKSSYLASVTTGAQKRNVALQAMMAQNKANYAASVAGAQARNEGLFKQMRRRRMPTPRLLLVR